METTLLSILPYLTPAGVLVLLIAFLFREPIIEWVRTKSVSKEIRDALHTHIKDEEAYWANSEGRFAELDKRLSAQELASTEYRILIARNHEEVIRALGETNAQIAQIGQAVIRTHERIDRMLTK